MRNYAVVKIYHALEKSLSLKSRNQKSGAAHCESILNILRTAKENNCALGFHDRVAANVLGKFVSQIEGVDKTPYSELLQGFKHDLIPIGGVDFYSSDDYKRGILSNPNEFFETRYSLREFGEKPVLEEELKKAIGLAIKAPSVCNRQPWHVYEIKDRELLDSVLALQNGNRGFGHKLNHLLVITSDLKAFFSSKERYQHWIDGGIFSMSLILALHSIGIASCCLNWSQDVKSDIALRKKIKIRDEHTVIMLLAIGYPDVENNVCVSPRRSVEDFYTRL